MNYMNKISKNTINILLLALLLVAPALLKGEKVAVLDKMVNPRNMLIDGDQMVLTDFPSIYLFSLKDYTLQKKFGGKGEGPGEFVLDMVDMSNKTNGLVSYITDKNIVVNSQGRISFFTKDGKYQRMTPKRFYGGAQGVRPWGDGFISRSMAKVDKNLFATLCLYNAQLKGRKEFFRCPLYRRLTNVRKCKLDYFERSGNSFVYDAHNGKIVVARAGGEVFCIKVYDATGKLLREIKRDFVKKPVTKAFIKASRDHYRVKFKRGLQFNLDHTIFPKYFPPIRTLKMADGKIYVVTYEQKGDDYKILVLDMEGKLLKELWLPIREQSTERLYPFGIQAGNLYQLVENDQEIWELNRFAL